MLALTQTPSLRMDLGVRTYVGREQLEFSRVLDQHAGYCRALAAAGASVRVLEVNSRFPDGVFIEDTAVILDNWRWDCEGCVPSEVMGCGIEPTP